MQVQRPKSLMQQILEDPPTEEEVRDLPNGEVFQWLGSLGLQRYAKGFLENGYDDIRIVPELTGEDLDIIGVSNAQDRKKLLAVVSSSPRGGNPLLLSFYYYYYSSFLFFQTRSHLSCVTHPVSVRAPSPDEPEDNEDAEEKEGDVDEDEDDDDVVPESPQDSSSQERPPASPPTSGEDRGKEVARQEKVTKSGYLSKQGGANKGWKKRWVVYDGSQQLRYYKTPQDKEPAGVIHLAEVIKIAFNDAESRKDPRYSHCFDVATSREGRTYVFSAEYEVDAKAWVEFLRAQKTQASEAAAAAAKAKAASTPRPSQAGEDEEIPPLDRDTFSMDRPGSVVPGGMDDPPDKHGWLKKMGNNMAKDWKRRYVALKGSRLFYFRAHEDYIAKEPINYIEMLTTTVKPSVVSGRYRFELVTLTRSYWFQTETQTELMDWVGAIQGAIAAALTTIQSQKFESQQRAVAASGGAEPFKLSAISGAELLETLRETEANRVCADCGIPDPDWTSINLGIMVCIECSGIHRGLGVHISKVRSLPLDEWTPGLAELMKALGNERVNRIWEAEVPATVRRLSPNDEREIKKEFITTKYSYRTYLAKAVKDLDQEARDRGLFEAVKTDDVAETARLFTGGASLRYVDAETRQPLLHAAVEAGQAAQVEYLLQNGADPLVVDAGGHKIDELAQKLDRRELAASLRMAVAKAAVGNPGDDFDDEARNKYRCGYLYKTGGSNKFWKRRWFIFDEDALRYFKLKEDKEPAGIIMLGDMVSISAREDPTGTQKFYFELESCLGRTYEFAADTQSQMLDWLDFLRVVIDSKLLSNSFSVAKFDIYSFEMHGVLSKRVDNQKVGRPRWFLLKAKNLYFFRDDTRGELLGSVDLRLVTSLAWSSSDEVRQRFSLRLPNRVYHLEASTPEEAETWMRALRETMTFGVRLEVVAKRKQGSHDKAVPLVLVKCLAYVVSHCNEVDRLFEEDGDQLLVGRLRTLFDQDDLSVNLNSLTTTAVEVAAVAQLIKVFFTELPEPLLPEFVAQNLVQIGKIEDESFLTMGCEELLKQLPEWNSRTFKKLLSSLNTIAEKQSQPAEARHRLALVFAPLVMRVGGLEQGLQVSVLAFLMRVANSIFKAILPEHFPRKPVRPHLQSSSSTVSDPGDLFTIATIVEVRIGNGATGLTFPCPSSMTVKELSLNLVKKLASGTPPNLCTNYSLFEVTPEFGKKPIPVHPPEFMAKLTSCSPLSSREKSWPERADLDCHVQLAGSRRDAPPLQARPRELFARQHARRLPGPLGLALQGGSLGQILEKALVRDAADWPALLPGPQEPRGGEGAHFLPGPQCVQRVYLPQGPHRVLLRPSPQEFQAPHAHPERRGWKPPPRRPRRVHLPHSLCREGG